jgi:hypothetical protein
MLHFSDEQKATVGLIMPVTNESASGSYLPRGHTPGGSSGSAFSIASLFGGILGGSPVSAEHANNTTHVVEVCILSCCTLLYLALSYVRSLG